MGSGAGAGCPVRHLHRVCGTREGSCPCYTAVCRRLSNTAAAVTTSRTEPELFGPERLPALLCLRRSRGRGLPDARSPFRMRSLPRLAMAPSSPVIWSRMLTRMDDLRCRVGAGELSTTTEWKTQAGPAWRPPAYPGALGIPSAISLHSEPHKANCGMTAIARAAAASPPCSSARRRLRPEQGRVQSRQGAGRPARRARAPRRRGPADGRGRSCAFLDQACAQGGRTGLMLQTLLETAPARPNWCSSGSRT